MSKHEYCWPGVMADCLSFRSRWDWEDVPLPISRLCSESNVDISDYRPQFGWDRFPNGCCAANTGLRANETRELSGLNRFDQLGGTVRMADLWNYHVWVRVPHLPRYRSSSTQKYLLLLQSLWESMHDYIWFILSYSVIYVFLLLIWDPYFIPNSKHTQASNYYPKPIFEYQVPFGQVKYFEHWRCVLISWCLSAIAITQALGEKMVAAKS